MYTRQDAAVCPLASMIIQSSSQQRTAQKICGCHERCKGLQKPVSLSTFNRHAKYRHEESFSTKFRSFLSQADSQLDGTAGAIPNNLPDSEVGLSAFRDAGTNVNTDIGEMGVEDTPGLGVSSEYMNLTTVYLTFGHLRTRISNLFDRTVLRTLFFQGILTKIGPLEHKLRHLQLMTTLVILQQETIAKHIPMAWRGLMYLILAAWRISHVRSLQTCYVRLFLMTQNCPTQLTIKTLILTSSLPWQS
jgi:hypothetical protein